MTVELSPPARLIMRTAHRDLEARLWDAHPAFVEELLDAGMVVRTIERRRRVRYHLTDAGKAWKAPS